MAGAARLLKILEHKVFQIPPVWPEVIVVADLSYGIKQFAYPAKLFSPL